MKKNIEILYKNTVDMIEKEKKKTLKNCVDNWISSYINIGCKRALERGETIIKEVYTIFEEAEKNPKNNDKAIVVSYKSFIAEITKRIVNEFNLIDKLKDNKKMAIYSTGYISGLKLIKNIIIKNCLVSVKKRVEIAMNKRNHLIILSDREFYKEIQKEA